MKKLVIVSHTEHFVKENNIVGWGPTVRELNAMTALFDEIVHIACLHPGTAADSCIPYNGNIRFIAIPPFGGSTLWQKLSVFRVYPQVIKHLRREKKHADWTQIRLPTGIGVLLLPWILVFGSRKRLWVKYAGNWKQDNPPAGYRFQRWWLEKNLLNVPVTINGRWPGQPAHLLSFENPCLTEEQLEKGREKARLKQFTPPFTFTFIGKLFESKGLMTMLNGLASIDRELIQRVHIIGEGEDRQLAEEFCRDHDLPAQFHGFLPVPEVHRLLEESHFIVLPSKSEGFPKVLAEGAAYGALCIASAVSAVPHYFRDNENGFLWFMDQESFSDRLARIPFREKEILSRISREAVSVARQFTFTAYLNKLQNKIFGKSDD